MTTTLDTLKEKATHHAARYEKFARIGAISIMGGAGVLLALPETLTLVAAPFVLPVAALPLYIGAFYGFKTAISNGQVKKSEKNVASVLENIHSMREIPIQKPTI